MLHLVATSPAPVSAPGDDAWDDSLLGFAGPVTGLNALIVAGRGPDLLCGLIRRGCLAATSLAGAAGVEACSYDLVLTPNLTAAVCPDQLIRLVRRALRPSGRLVARVADAVGGTGLAARHVRLLKLNGFMDVRTKAVPRAILLRADLPPVPPHIAAWRAAAARRP